MRSANHSLGFDSTLDVRGVGFAYPDSPSVLRDLSATFRTGQSVAIVGRSGEGKSTFISIVGLLMSPSSGTYLVGSDDVAALPERARAYLRSHMFGFVFQDHVLDPALSLEDNLVLPCLIQSGVWTIRAARKRVAAIASLMEIGQLLARKPNQVSVGQRQRAAVVRALAHQPAFVLADEPTGALDPSTADLVFELLLSLARDQGVGLIVVTHDDKLAARCDRRYQLADGRLHE